MDNYLFISRLCLATLLVLGCYGQGDDDLATSISYDGDGPSYSRAGAKLVQLNCTVNRGPLYSAVNPMSVLHRNPVSQEETVMSHGNTLEAKPEFYSIQLIPNADQTQFITSFTILTVRDQDDGFFICKSQTKDKPDEIATVEMELVVVKPVQEVHLQFDGNDPVTKRPTESLEVDPGVYEVKCIAVGSNPGSKDVELHLDGQLVESSKVSIVMSDQATDSRSFVSSISAQVTIDVKTSGKDLQCVSKDLEDNPMIAELGIHVNTYDPHIVCNDSDAHMGQMHPMLTCTVNHTDIDVKRFAFQIGKTGELIEDGKKNSKNMEVKSMKVADEVTEVSLTLQTAEGWHFTEDFYIVIESNGGHVTKERVILNKVEKPNNGGGNSNAGSSGNKGDGDTDAAVCLDGRTAVVLSLLIGLMMQLF